MKNILNTDSPSIKDTEPRRTGKRFSDTAAAIYTGEPTIRCDQCLNLRSENSSDENRFLGIAAAVRTIIEE